MKELKEFTVERLEEIIEWTDVFGRHPKLDECTSLAKIALAAKQAEPDYYIHGVEVCDSYVPDIELRAFNDALDASKCKDDHGGEIIPVYTTPPLSAPCIKCNDTGIADSGGTQPWGEPISVECDCTTPPLNHTEQHIVVPDGWIKCSDQLPPDDDFVLIWPLPDFGVDLHVGQYMKFHKKGAGWFAQVNEQNYGVEWYPIAVTHWMKLPAAPKPEM